MFLHQALPKDAQLTRKPTYQIRRKFSPKAREITSKHLNISGKNGVQSLGNSLSKNEANQMARIHLISSKDKPALSSVEKKKKSPVPKQISSICIKKSILRTETTPQKRTQLTQHQSNFLQRQISEKQKFQQEFKKALVICKIQNKATKTVSCSLLYTDLSTIDESYQLIYQGQTKGNRIRHGFGCQTFTNGEKFVGIFHQNKAHGQGTYYSLKKKIMGNWQNDRLKEVIIQL